MSNRKKVNKLYLPSGSSIEFVESEKEENSVLLNSIECHLLALEFSTHFINRDRYEETRQVLNKIFRVDNKREG